MKSSSSTASQGDLSWVSARAQKQVFDPFAGTGFEDMDDDINVFKEGKKAFRTAPPAIHSIRRSCTRPLHTLFCGYPQKFPSLITGHAYSTVGTIRDAMEKRHA